MFDTPPFPHALSDRPSLRLRDRIQIALAIADDTLLRSMLVNCQPAIAPARKIGRISSAICLSAPQQQTVDGIVESEEQARLTSLLAERFELEKDQATQLMEDARQADQQAVDLYRFTSVLMRSLEHEERVAIIENMWEMVYADGVVHEMEDNIVWRVAELLAVDSRERVLLKQRVRDRTGNA